MLNIKTVKNPLVADESKDGFCFRSSCSQTLTQGNLAKEMADYNASFTEADFKGMLDILKTISLKYLIKGYAIELPFCTVKPSVNGTCGSIQDSFVPYSGNNQFSFILSVPEEHSNNVFRNIEYKQVSPEPTGLPKIYRLCTLKADASESKVLEVLPSKSIRIHGRNLSFDFTDEKQGVFIQNENVEIRIKEFGRAGTNIIDAVIPSDVDTGNYNVTVVSKPGISYFIETSIEQLSIK